MRHLISVVSDEKAQILDFFSGSGTTAHAVMELNSQDNGERKSISIQLAENTTLSSEAFQSGYKTIFDITKARITKAAQKIKENNPEYEGDLGFKVFETVADFRATTDEELTLSQPTMFDDVMLTDEQYHTLLTTWSLYDGGLLTTSIEKIDLGDYQAHYCDGRLYLIASSFSTNALKALLTKLDEDKAFAPHKVVFYGHNFESAKQMELNEALKSYANKKSLELEVVVRY
jgi:adenine-specific DNA-methyltransferase